MKKNNNGITARISRRELATILAALRFHQDENLQGGQEIPGGFLREIATDCGTISPLSFKEVSRLCERLNLDEGDQPSNGLVIEPPPKDRGDEPLFRVVYVIDVMAANSIGAARRTHRIMTDPDSQPPVLEVINHRGKKVSIDLSHETPT